MSTPIPEENLARFTLQESVVLDGSGNGQIRMAPTDKKWSITNYAVKCTLLPGETFPVSEAQCNVYIGSVSDVNRIEGTFSGSSGDQSDTRVDLEQGHGIFFVWTGGDAGTTATAKIIGYQSVPAGRGFRSL